MNILIQKQLFVNRFFKKALRNLQNIHFFGAQTLETGYFVKVYIYEKVYVKQEAKILQERKRQRKQKILKNKGVNFL